VRDGRTRQGRWQRGTAPGSCRLERQQWTFFPRRTHYDLPSSVVSSDGLDAEIFPICDGQIPHRPHPCLLLLLYAQISSISPERTAWFDVQTDPRNRPSERHREKGLTPDWFFTTNQRARRRSLTPSCGRQRAAGFGAAVNPLTGDLGNQETRKCFGAVTRGAAIDVGRPLGSL
jgi:hypothetical protein